MSTTSKSKFHIIVNDRYVIAKLLGSGSFGEIYAGIDNKLPKTDPNKLVAIKLEKHSKDTQLLNNESKLYTYLYREHKGIPRVFWSGTQDEYNVLVIEILGPNLETLFELCGHQFTLKTVIIIAQELLKIIQYIHSRGVVHRDIKPENFLIGLQSNELYVIDFGLCKFFKNPDRTHIPPTKSKKLVGTIRYASLNSHNGMELSRRDDLISIGYMLIYFIKGHLPWQGLCTKDTPRDVNYNLIKQCKQNTTNEQLCQCLPKEFKLYMDYVCSLGFSDKPDYNYLFNLFTQLFKKNAFEYDDNFDWTRFKK